ncbi:ribosome small subunit-dependent GTPase A [Streptomyces sp. URMC 123]|uniref:ribosome small subunit-dependent GTPase A n=1 Tax=Streptomyces sp. URMC 123 TaxID=3423403 RepID=UPI003F1A9676
MFHASLNPSTTTPSRAPSTGAPHDVLVPYGWDADWAAAFDAHASAFDAHAGTGLVPGRIARVDRGRCDLVVADGPGGTAVVQADTAPVATPDPVAFPCTGDWAVLDTGQGAVTALLPRRTAFVRATSSERSEGQILAANVDHAIVAAPLSAEVDLGRVERFLALAWESGAQPLVVLTKADLVPDAEGLGYLVDDVRSAAPGAQVIAVSAETGQGIDELRAHLGRGTAVLLGQSGAGKSTLANALLGADLQEVNAVRDRDGKGRHTTTTRNLFAVPGGGVLIDTPGLRGVGIWDAGAGVAQVFAEIEALAERCRFHDCAHAAEPGCAVRAAVEDGELPQRRLESYGKLLRENQRLAARTDARLRAELRRDWKRKQEQGRQMVQWKRGGAPR